MTRGLIVGAFMPPHAGHQLLVATALGLVDELAILVRHAPDDPIPGPLRMAWLSEMFPRAHVAEHRASDWPAPDGHPERRTEWRAIASRLFPQPIDLVFGADARAVHVAEAVGARPVLVDPGHESVPASARAIRADPVAQWDFLPDVVRPHYARTICLHGPESTGKSTLAALLARHYGTILVPEYGRTYCEQFGLDLAMDDLVAIARTHAAMTRAALRRCNRRLFLDTDPLMTAAWSRMLFGMHDPWFDHFSDRADLYLLLDIDLPWVDDGTRFFGEDAARRRFFDLSREELERRGCRYRVIGGPHQSRFASAVEAIAAAGL